MSDTALNGARILVVEDEAVIAFDLRSMLLEAGAVVVGPAATLVAAQELAANSELSAAILDIRVGDRTIFPLAKLLTERGIPFAFHTGHADDQILALDWPDAEILIKPVGRAMILAAVARLLARRS